MRDSGVQNNIGPHWLSLYEGEQQKKKRLSKYLILCGSAIFAYIFIIITSLHLSAISTFVLAMSVIFQPKQTF